MQRDLRIDSIRGILLYAIGIEHMGVSISGHFNHMLGIFSFAEALVFMSGLVTGITVYKTWSRRGMNVVTSHALERFRAIYLGHIIPCFIILVLAALSANALYYFKSYMPILTSVSDGSRNYGDVLLYMLPLLYQPNYFDIFPMFMLYMLLSPLFAYFVGKKQSFVIFALSGGLWLAIQFGFGRHWFHDWTINNVAIGGIFDPFAWQFLFLIAFYFGFNMHRGLPAFTRRPDFLALCGVICLTGLAARYGLLPYVWHREGLLFSKKHLSILRLINFLAFVCLLAEFGRHFPKILIWRSATLLGQHSLQVFSYQIVLIYLSSPIMWRLSEKSPILADAYTLIIMLTQALPALAHIQYRKWRARYKNMLATETPK